jgi:hypothetical protein
MSDVVTKLREDLKILPLLEQAPPSFPESVWEGLIVTPHPANSDDDGIVRASLIFSSDFITGAGTARGKGSNAPRYQVQLEGEMAASITLRVWLDAPFHSATPFVCTGSINADEDHISGHWRRKCSDSCTCEGRRGTFDLRRVVCL